MRVRASTILGRSSMSMLKNYISEKLKEYWSPEQIMGRLELDKKIKISTETAYRFVLQDKAVGGALYKYLRHQHKKVSTH
jgi:IS30 family transposase